MFTVHLKNMRFFAHHGLHDEEGITGTQFEVSIDVTIPTDMVTSIHETINYVSVFEIIKKRFLSPARLLETLAQDITKDVCKLNEHIITINITISKLNPPIDNFTGIAGITYSKSFP